MKIKIFSVGGTIDKVYFDSLSEYQVGSSSIQEILDRLPLAFKYEIESLFRKDSLNMNETDRLKIRAAVENEECKRILITHGTDTMIDTAKALIGIPGKIIVLTGAMMPACFKSSDADFNIGVAIGALGVQAEGVYLAMSGRIFDPCRCYKNRSLHVFEGGAEKGND